MEPKEKMSLVNKYGHSVTEGTSHYIITIYRDFIYVMIVGAIKKKHPVNGNSVDGNTLMMSEVGGE